MKTKTIIILSTVLIFVNAALGVTIYFLMKPEAKTATLDKIAQIQLPDIKLPEWELPEITMPAFDLPEIELPKFQLPEVELPEIEVTEEDVTAVADSMKQKLLERAQLTSDEVDEQTPNEEEDVTQYEYVVAQWGMTFQLPTLTKDYRITFSQDVLTIERHLQVMAYIARYDEGVAPAINGQWELLASYGGSDYYVRKGSAVTYSAMIPDNVDNSGLEDMRQDVYNTILKTFHFSHE